VGRVLQERRRTEKKVEKVGWTKIVDFRENVNAFAFSENIFIVGRTIMLGTKPGSIWYVQGPSCLM
jgi:hypothetical protein